MSELYHLTDDIYALPGDITTSRPWIGVVMSAVGTALIDSGNGPRHGHELQRALNAAGAAPVTHIFLTHHHWDHHFGSVAFPDATIIAHEWTQRHLTVMADEPWSRDYVYAKADRFPRGKVIARQMDRAVGDWSAFRPLPATITFKDEYTLPLGDYRIRIWHVGGQHEPDQALVQVTPGNVLFLGDAAYGRASSTDDWDKAALAATLRAFAEETGAAWFVEGHRTPSERAPFLARVERLMRSGA